jgi:site-specific recombinase XerD
MSPASAREVAVTRSPGLLADYLAHVDGLDLSGRARRDRRVAATRFLATFGDLEEWMARPAPARVVDLKRTGAWPLVVFAIAGGHVRLDLELAGVKNLTGLGDAIRATDPDGFTRAQVAGLQLGWGQAWVDTVLDECLAVILACTGRRLEQLDDPVIDAFDTDLATMMTIPGSSRKAYRARLASLRRILFELRITDQPPRRRPWSRTLEQRFDDVVMPTEIRVVLLRYVHVRATVLRPNSVESLIDDLLPFAEFLHAHHPQVTSLRQLSRDHIEGFLAWNRHRNWRGRKARPVPVSDSVAQSAVLTLRNMFEDITAWGWTEAPTRQLVFTADIPKLGRPLPRALPPTVDAALMAAVTDLPDLFAAVGLQVLRGAGLRVGELLDLECDAVLDYGPAGTWLRVPLGKLATERAVPLNPGTLAVLDSWATQRSQHRPIPHPRTGRPTHFLFTEHGRRLGATRLRNGLQTAIHTAGLTDPTGQPLRITPHQLRHTYATELANAGMSLQALMALLGHVTSEMTIRYATLAPTTLNTAYENAVAGLRPQLPIAAPARPIIPDRITWLNAEMIKTRLGTGYCARHHAAGPCDYANICETCDNFTPAPEFAPALADQLADTRALHADAEQRGWTDEAQRHQRVSHALEAHLRLLQPR